MGLPCTYNYKGTFTMAVTKKEQRTLIDKIFIMLGAAVMVVLLIIGGVAWKGYTFASGQVHDQLAAQNIYFPAAGSEGFDAAEYPAIQQYAGQRVDNAAKAKAYADDYIGHHLKGIADGKSYAEVSTLAKANPTDAKLQAQKQTLFQGEMLRGLLLTAGYGYGTMGELAKIAALTFFAGAILLLILVILGLLHLQETKKRATRS